MGEISNASAEQAQGVVQIAEAVTQMDQATQQNASLVVEMAAAASNLESLAQEQVQAMAIFTLSHESAHVVRVGMRRGDGQPAVTLLT
jgi:methyl-accepting chemotaxis protein